MTAVCGQAGAMALAPAVRYATVDTTLGPLVVKVYTGLASEAYPSNFWWELRDVQSFLVKDSSGDYCESCKWLLDHWRPWLAVLASAGCAASHLKKARLRVRRPDDKEGDEPRMLDEHTCSTIALVILLAHMGASTRMGDVSNRAQAILDGLVRIFMGSRDIEFVFKLDAPGVVTWGCPMSGAGMDLFVDKGYMSNAVLLHLLRTRPGRVRKSDRDLLADGMLLSTTALMYHDFGDKRARFVAYQLLNLLGRCIERFFPDLNFPTDPHLARHVASKRKRADSIVMDKLAMCELGDSRLGTPGQMQSALQGLRMGSTAVLQPESQALVKYWLCMREAFDSTNSLQIACDGGDIGEKHWLIVCVQGMVCGQVQAAWAAPQATLVIAVRRARGEGRNILGMPPEAARFNNHGLNCVQSCL